MANLLPASASALERAAAEALSALGDVDVPLRDLWSSQRCPQSLLPYLAWAFSVDRWDDSWPQSIKRDVIEAAWDLHRHKGTILALRRVIEPLGFLILVDEWWQQTPPGTPGTFNLEIAVTAAGIDAETFAEMTALIDEARPVSRHLTSLSLVAVPRGDFYTGGSTQMGDITTIGPNNG